MTGEGYPWKETSTLAWLKRALDKPLCSNTMAPVGAKGKAGATRGLGLQQEGDLKWTNWGRGLIHSSFGEEAGSPVYLKICLKSLGGMIPEGSFSSLLSQVR